MTYLVENETATWTQYTPEQIIEVKDQVKQINKTYKESLTKKEEGELSL